MPATAIAQDVEPHDYHGHSYPPNLLKNVEKFHVKQGIKKMEKGNLQFAYQDFHFMLSHFPNHPRALHLMGQLTIKMDTPAKGEQFFKRAIRLYPDRSTTYAVYGIFLHKLERLDEAISKYKKALELNPQAVEPMYNLGLAYFDNEQYELANQYAQQAYNKGFPLPGLRQKLKEQGAWNPDVTIEAQAE